MAGCEDPDEKPLLGRCAGAFEEFYESGAGRGRVVAQGTHAQLMRSSPIYQEIYDSQLGDGPLGAAARPGLRGATDD